jgi:hypothetical protein
MLEIFGKQYYIDVNRITEECRIDDTESSEKIETENTEEVSQTINIFKYELLKMFVERVLSENIEEDDSIGVFASENTSISFKMAFNTLIKNNILIENDDE